MDYCKYHPLTPATYECPSCRTSHCDQCVDDSKYDAKCFICGHEQNSLGAANLAIPFWRRLQESFRYPLSSQPAIVMGVMALISVMVSSGFLPIILLILLYLLTFAAFMKYCFTCLFETSTGNFDAPDITGAYGGGFKLLLQLLAIFIVAGLFEAALIFLLGIPGATLGGLLIVIALPAIFIIFGITDSLGDAINPRKIHYLISSIGLPYGLLLGLIIVMMGSMGVVSQLFVENTSAISQIIQSLISSYYSIVMFHIMGYMIFQYQSELGFTAREQENRQPRPERERRLAQIDVVLKEGDFAKVTQLFKQLLKEFKNDQALLNRYFDWLCATHSIEELEVFTQDFFEVLIQRKQAAELARNFKRVRTVHPTFKPSSLEHRYAVALACQAGGDPKSAAALLNGLQKEFPDSPHLAETFSLMAECLDDIPHKQEAAKKCRELVETLKQRKPSQNDGSNGGSVAPLPNPIAQPASFSDAEDNLATAPQGKDNQKPSQSTPNIAEIKATEEEPKEKEPEEEGKDKAAEEAPAKDLPPLDFK